MATDAGLLVAGTVGKVATRSRFRIAVHEYNYFRPSRSTFERCREWRNPAGTSNVCGLHEFASRNKGCAVKLDPVTRSQLILLCAQAARLILYVAVAALLGRRLAPEDFGFVALVSSIYIVAIEMLDMGTAAVAIREIAARPDRERETLASLLALRRLAAALAFVLILGLTFSNYVEHRNQRLVLVVVAFGLFLLHLHAYQLVFQIRQAYGQLTVLGLSGQLGFLLLSLAALRMHAGGAAIALLVVIREMVQVLGTRWLALRTLGEPLRASWLPAAMWPLLKSGWMIGMAGVCYKLSTYSGGFMLWELAAPEALASFSAAQRLLVPMADMAWLFVTPLIASLGVAAARDVTTYRLQMEGYAKLMLGASSLVAVAGYSCAPLVLRLLYGEQYASGPWSAVSAFRWLALACLFALVTPLFAVGETSQGRARPLLFTGLACLGLNFAGNICAIPRYGSEGAAMVLCACEAFVLLALLTRCIRRGEARVDPTWAIYLAPAALLGLAMRGLDDFPVIQMVVSCVWVPAAMLVMSRLPAQQKWRASLDAASSQWQSQTGAGTKATPADPR